MASSWIRNDVSTPTDPHFLRARRILHVSVPTMLGMLNLMEMRLLEQHPTGELAAVSLDALGEWAHWEGDMDRFQEALDALTEEGKFFGWDDRHGVRIDQLERDRKRKREYRDKRRVQGTSEGQQQMSEGRPPDKRENPRDVSTRNETERDETRRDVKAKSEGTAASSTLFANGAAPPAAVALLAHLPPGQHAKVRREMGAYVTGKLVHRKHPLAGSVARLERMCQRTVDEIDAGRVIRSPWAYTLEKLADTSDDSAPGVAVETAAAEEREDDEVQRADDLQAALDWMPEELAAEMGPEPKTPVMRMTWEARLLHEWRRAQPMTDDPPEPALETWEAVT